MKKPCHAFKKIWYFMAEIKVNSIRNEMCMVRTPYFSPQKKLVVVGGGGGLQYMKNCMLVNDCKT
jgi:hypothetical protein